MSELEAKKSNRFAAWFRLCPARHVLSAAGLLLIGTYFALRSDRSAMEWAYGAIVRPWREFARKATGALPFSLAECLIVAAIAAGLAYIVFTIVCLLRFSGKWTRLYRLFTTALTAFALIYAGFCVLWGVYYYVADFEEQSGIAGRPVSTEQLEAVTRYFTDLVNDYGERVARDENGVFAEDLGGIFDYSGTLYAAVERDLPCLAGDAVPAKRFFFSRAMSYINFTGFYFPFTGEANVNVDSPACFVPSTIAHELAHQRGVAEEDEANFVAVLASLTDGDARYCYSACLLAYVHLGNALYRADYDAWLDNFQRLSPGVRADLAENSAYWARFETPVSTVADSVYTGFLHSYGQTLGLQTHGKCVDLLVAYYYDMSAAE